MKKITEIQTSNYCTRGIGFATNDPTCKTCSGDCQLKRVASGGPDLEKEMMGHSARVTVGLVLPDSIKSKQDLSEYLSKIYQRGSDEYKAAYALYSPQFQMATHT